MYVHVIGRDPQAAEEAASGQKTTPGESLVPESAKTLGNYFRWIFAFCLGDSAQEVHGKVQYCPVCTKPGCEERSVKWKN